MGSEAILGTDLSAEGPGGAGPAWTAGSADDFAPRMKRCDLTWRRAGGEPGPGPARCSGLQGWTLPQRGVTFSAREEWLGYSSMFPSKLKITPEDNTHFFQEPDEAWAWHDMYHADTDGGKNTEHKPPRRRGKRRHTRDTAENKQVTKPTQQQACQGKRVALQAAAYLAEVRNSDKELGSGLDPLDIGESTDENSVVSAIEGLPQVSPLSLMAGY
ncbi:hypothetical protein NDU88_006067 [Pleurodeles waltl]|uniref:Uncharacterized protein n=1 Tax=Pleurodeles waltl TaxID=8319 RepID=A0AAV7TW26_PLEWA|nr:hypothetical protein NDU88_006067 [Pleurodeles waltl]